MIRQVTLSRATRKTDKTVSINFITDLEESSEGFMEIDKLLQSRGILYYSDKGELTQAEVNELDNVDIELEGKSKSKRLRSVIWRNCEQHYGRKPTDKEFQEYYSVKMEVIIQHYKDKLD